MVKRGVCLLLAVGLVFSLVGCSGAEIFYLLVAMGDDRADKEDIFVYVRENEDALSQAIENGTYSDFENEGVIKDISADDEVVGFYCGGAGMGGETSYIGFYYSPKNDMAAIWCAPESAEDLIPSGNGYEWLEPHGDNRYYTEHICGNFYYYEASF